MKILLTAINAKYIHSNLAVYSLRAYAQPYLRMKGNQLYKEQNDTRTRTSIEIAEYTINQQTDQILVDIYKKGPDMLCLSCYIWNISQVEELVVELRKLLPELSIWLGGPEVSYDSAKVLKRLPQITGVIKGEGEETFARLAAGEEKSELLGITYRDESGEIIENPWRPVMDLSEMPFVYNNMEDFEHKIIYYESSRGCPFSCSYCLSSVDKQLRFRDIELVKRELKFFIDREVPQVKFVDRTFNCRHDHAVSIWRYLVEHDKGITNFHFEISADLLNEEEIALIQSMRPGLIQLEIGIQSTNVRTIKEINRTMRFDEVARRVGEIREAGNVHQHLDLIAGLPFEDIQSFAKSFNEVYALKPEQLQLGFLKVLKGSCMEERKAQYELKYKDKPPYEVLCTKWLSYEDILRLKGIEEMVEVYYNSGQFSRSLEMLEGNFESPFDMYDRLYEYYEDKGHHMVSHSRVSRYEILLQFVTETVSEAKQVYYRELLTYDYYLRENAKTRPGFAGEYKVSKEEVRIFYEREEEHREYLKGYEQYDRNQMRRMTHLERFEYLDQVVLFDYSCRNLLTKEARAVIAKLP